LLRIFRGEKGWIGASSWMTMRMHSSPRMKALTSCKPAKHPRSPSISADRPVVFRLRKVQAGACFPDPPGIFGSAFLPVQPRWLLAAGHRGKPYIRDRSACAPRLSDWETVLTLDPPTDSLTPCSKFGFLRASMSAGVATQPQSVDFLPGRILVMIAHESSE
jgi:hypothetical protein